MISEIYTEAVAKKAAALERKAKRKASARFNAKVSGRKILPSIKALKNKLWDLNTLAVMKRDGSMCRACKKNPGYAQNHIVPQCEGPGLVYDLDNIFWGCSSCNAAEKFRRGWWRGEVFPSIFGAEYVDNLWKRSRHPSQLRRGELNALIAAREEYLGVRRA